MIFAQLRGCEISFELFSFVAVFVTVSKLIETDKPGNHSMNLKQLQAL